MSVFETLKAFLGSGDGEHHAGSDKKSIPADTPISVACTSCGATLETPLDFCPGCLAAR